MTNTTHKREKGSVAHEAERIRVRRLGRSVKGFVDAKDALDRQNRLRGGYAMGRDERGAAVETVALSELNIALDKWFVSVSFRKEDATRLPEHYLDAEEAFRRGPLPRKPVWTSTHILSAVRLLRHIREGYERELNLLDQLLRPIEDAEAALKVGPAPGKLLAHIDMAIGHLTLCRQRFERSEVLVKRVIVPSNIDRVVGSLQEVREAKPDARDDLVRSAAKELSRLRSRIEMRQRQVSGMKWKGRKEARAGGLKQFSTRREHALRVVRDQWLLAQMMRLAESVDNLPKYAKDDLRKLAVLDAVLSTLKTPARDRLDTALKYLEANWRIFEVRSRSKDGVMKRIIQARKGVVVDDGKKLDYQYGNYKLLYYHLWVCKQKRDEAAALRAKASSLQKDASRLRRQAARIGPDSDAEALARKIGLDTQAADMEERVRSLRSKAKELNAQMAPARANALVQLDAIKLFVNANKPAFILDEIRETVEGYRDGYLALMIPHLEQAIVALNNGAPDPHRAREHFIAAADALRSAIGKSG